ncbi:MAG: DUF4783 domain-containing protein [Bacteroidota bacterium]
MNTRLFISLIFIAIFFNGNLSFAGNPPLGATQDEVSLAIKSGNAAALALHFNSTIDLLVPGQELTCSKIQAEQIVKDFFAKNPPKSFKINHQGSSKDGSQFSIVTYVSTNNKSFRTYFLLKKTPSGMSVQQLQFEIE